MSDLNEGGARVETDGGRVRVDLDAVTPREMHAHLERVHERIGEVDDRVGDVQLNVEKRFSRVEKMILGLGAVVASPKLGGPSLPDVATAAIGFLPT